MPLDVTDGKSAHQAAGWIEAEYGRLDILVNNAGIARGDGSGLPSETLPDTLREVFETNVFGVVTVTNAMLPLLRRAPAARIVNVSSEVGSIGPMTDPGSPRRTLATARRTSTAIAGSGRPCRAPRSLLTWRPCPRTGRPGGSGATRGPRMARSGMACCPGNPGPAGVPRSRSGPGQWETVSWR